MLDPVNRLKSVFDQTARHGSYCVMTACVLDNTLDGSERREPGHVQRQPRSGNAKHFLAHSIRARTGFSDAKRVRMPVPIDRPNSMTASVSVSCAVGAGFRAVTLFWSETSVIPKVPVHFADVHTGSATR